ncbi:MAG: serine/threonine-protein kinase [Cyanobacteria bacterium P01_F01_bin.150]
MAGQILGDRYQVEKQLGKKSGRWTLLAEDLETQQPVILKLISMDDGIHPDMLKLFEREVTTLKSLDHPDLPQFLDYFEIDLPKEQKALVLVQTYIDGVSINKYLKQGRTFTESETRTIAKAVLKILIYLHDHDPTVIHRDIKPSNVLLAQRAEESETKGTQICLVDFGSVQSLMPKPSRPTILALVGSEDYMAPEQLGGRALKASDLYSVGMTALSLLTGLEPVDFPRSGSSFNFLTLSDITPDFITWLETITATNLEHRFQSAQAALDALRAIPKAASL